MPTRRPETLRLVLDGRGQPPRPDWLIWLKATPPQYRRVQIISPLRLIPNREIARSAKQIFLDTLDIKLYDAFDQWSEKQVLDGFQRWMQNRNRHD